SDMPSRERPVTVRIDGSSYELVGGTADAVQLIEQTTGEERRVPPAELAEVLATGTDRSPRLFDSLRDDTVGTVLTLAADLDEVLTGVGRNKMRRPEYAPAATSQEQRVQRKLRELEAT